MSDVTVAPQGGAPAAAPQQSEVPINPNPTSQPNPVGSQAPPAPTGDVQGSPHRPESRREAIQRAVERAERAANQGKPVERHAPKEAPKAAEAKPGHNKPPEDTPRFDLKKRPSDQAGSIQDPQPRDRGRFAPREPAAGAAPGAAAPAAPARPAQQQRPQLPSQAPYRDPPSRMADHAKVEWHATPESVRGEVTRLHQEIGRAWNAWKGDVEAFKPIKQFHEMAQAHGTTLDRALTNYVSMEQKLRSDPIAGLDLIVHNLGLKSADGTPIGLRDIAYHVLTQTPEQLRMTQQGNSVQAAAHQIGALHQKVAGLENTLQQMHNVQQFTYTRSAVDQFAETHPRFDELGDLINQEIKLGFPLEVAYRRAELLRPTTHAAQTRNTSAQTRPPADRSIHGSPDAGSNGAQRRSPPKDASRSPRDAVANAIKRVSGSY
jgi:hypothetical protein